MTTTTATTAVAANATITASAAVAASWHASSSSPCSLQLLLLQLQLRACLFVPVRASVVSQFPIHRAASFDFALLRCRGLIRIARCYHCSVT